MKVLDLINASKEQRVSQYASCIDSIGEDDELCVNVPDLNTLVTLYRNYESTPFALLNIVERDEYYSIFLRNKSSVGRAKILAITQNRCPGTAAQVNVTLKLLQSDEFLHLVVLMENFNFKLLLENIKKNGYQISDERCFFGRFYSANVHAKTTEHGLIT